MVGVNAPNEILSSLAANLDKLNRGGVIAGSVDVKLVLTWAHSILDWIMSITEQDLADNPCDSKEFDTISEKGKRLYLQAQTLRASGKLLEDLRATVLGTGSLMLARFKKCLPQALQAQLALKISSAAADLSALGNDHQHQKAVAHCSIQSLVMLRQLDTLTLAQVLSPREIEQVQVALMTEYLRVARLLLIMKDPLPALLNMGATKTTNKCALSRECVSESVLIAQRLDASATVRLCELLLALGEELYSTVSPDEHRELQEDSAYFLALARERLELCVSTAAATPESIVVVTTQPRPSVASTRSLRLNLTFSLAHVWSKLGQNEKALALVEEAEVELQAISSTDAHQRTEAEDWTLSFLIPFAKFHICSSQSNWMQAKLHLLDVIRSQANVDVCIGLVRRYVEGNACSPEGQRELFQLCAKSFPAGTAHTEVLMARLQALLGSTLGAGTDSAHLQEALTLARELVDCRDSANPLSENHRRALDALLRSRVSYFLATGQWGLVEHWAALLLRMLGADNDADYIITSPAVAQGGGRIEAALAPVGSRDVLLLRAHARSQMGRHADAQADCERAWTLDPCKDTALAAFCAEMHALSARVPSTSTELSSTAQNKISIERFLRHCDSLNADGSIRQGEVLFLLAQAARIARDMPTTAATAVSKDHADLVEAHSCKGAYRALLRCWITRYESIGAWRLPATEATLQPISDLNSTAQSSPSLLRMVSELMQCCLEDMLLCYPAPSDRTDNSDCLPSLSTLTGSTDSDKENQVPTPRLQVNTTASSVDMQGALLTADSASFSRTAKRARSMSADSDTNEPDSEEPVVKKGPRRRFLRRPAMEEAERLSQEKRSLMAQDDRAASAANDEPSTCPEEEEPTAPHVQADAVNESFVSTMSTLSMQVPAPGPVSFFQFPRISNGDLTALDRANYVFAAPLSQLLSDLVAPLQAAARLLAAANSEKLQHKLGSFAEALWLADLSWNLANMLVHKERCSILAESDTAATMKASSAAASSGLNLPAIVGFEAGPHDSARLLTAAHLFEMAETFYAACSECQEGHMHCLALSKNRHSCLLVGAACRLDAHELGNAQDARQAKLLSAAAESAQRAFDMSRRDAGFQDADALQLRQTALLLLFTALCRSGDGLEKGVHGSNVSPSEPAVHSAVGFLNTHKAELQSLSAPELLRLAGVAAAGSNCPAVVTYRLLTLAWDRTLEPPLPGEAQSRDYATAGDIQCRLLLLAPSPTAALEHVQTFSELCGNTTASDDPNQPHSVRCDTVDQACSVAFNFGVTLSEVGQAKLAEQFIAHAVALLSYASPAFRNVWQSRMERAYYSQLQQLLPRKAQLAGHGMPRGLATFGLEPPTKGAH